MIGAACRVYTDGIGIVFDLLDCHLLGRTMGVIVSVVFRWREQQAVVIVEDTVVELSEFSLFGRNGLLVVAASGEGKGGCRDGYAEHEF